jgi:hypothetical protein
MTGGGGGMQCRVRHHNNWVKAAWEKCWIYPRILTFLHYNINSALTQLTWSLIQRLLSRQRISLRGDPVMWSLTPHWLSWHGVLFRIDSVCGRWNKPQNWQTKTSLMPFKGHLVTIIMKGSIRSKINQKYLEYLTKFALKNFLTISKIDFRQDLNKLRVWVRGQLSDFGEEKN